MSRNVNLLCLLLLTLCPCRMPGNGPIQEPVQEPAQKPAQATPAPPEPDVVIESRKRFWRFEMDGTSIYESTGAVRILRESGLRKMAVVVLPYAEGSQKLEVDYVRVRKPDGTLVETPTDTIQDRSAEVAAGAPMYSDMREKHIAVKSLAVGDILELHFTNRVLRPDVPDHFWMNCDFHRGETVREELIEVSYPATRPVQISSPTLDPETRIEGARKILTWRRIQPTPVQPAVRAPWKGAEASDIQISSFRSWRELGDWYRPLQSQGLELTPALRRKAQELTKGLAGERERIQVLYDFVSLKQHYIGISFGLGRYKPHAADQVLANGYGDCKDKHTLLSALLKAIGIEAWPALIRTAGEIRPDLPSPAQFDHVITVVPQGKNLLWLDTTPEIAPFGWLARSLQGKQALLIPPSGEARLQETPNHLTMPSENRFTFHGKLEKGGTLTGRCTLDLRGDLELGLRQAFRTIPQARWQELVTESASLPGIGNEFSAIQCSACEDTRVPFSISWVATRTNASEWNRKRFLLPLPGTGLGGILARASRPTDPVFFLAGNTFIFKAIVELPVPPALPPPVHLTHRAGEYSSEYAYTDGKLSVERRLRLVSEEISSQERSSLRTFLQGIEQDEQQFVALGSDSKTELPPEAVRAFEKALEALRAEDIRGGREALRKTLELAPEFPGAHGALATTYLAKGDEDSAIRECLKEEELHPETPFTYEVLSGIYLSKGRMQEAKQQMKLGLKQDPLNHNLLMNYIQILDKEKQPNSAIEPLEQALALEPDQPEYSLLLAEHLAQAGQTGRLEALARKAVQMDGRAGMLARASILLAGARIALDQAQAWGESSAKALSAESESLPGESAKGVQRSRLLAGVWRSLGICHLEAGRLPEATRYLESSWNLTLEAPVAMDLARAYGLQGKRKEAANLYELASVCQGADQLAIAQAYKALMGQPFPDGPAAFMQLGASGMPANRLHELKTWRIAHPHPRSWAPATLEFSRTGLEAIHGLEAGRDLEAITAQVKRLPRRLTLPDETPVRLFVNAFIEFGNPNTSPMASPTPPKGRLLDASVPYTAAKTAYAQGRYPRARDLVAIVQSMNPSHAESYWLLGMIEYSENHFKACRAHFQKCLRLAPGGPKAADIRRMLSEPAIKNAK